MRHMPHIIRLHKSALYRGCVVSGSYNRFFRRSDLLGSDHMPHLSHMGSRQFCLTLSEDAATRIASRVQASRGSVPGYAAELATMISKLPETRETMLRRQIADEITLLEQEGVLSAQRTPFAPQRLSAEADKLRSQVEPQRPQARKRRSHPSKRDARDAAHSAAA